MGKRYQALARLAAERLRVRLRERRAEGAGVAVLWARLRPRERGVPSADEKKPLTYQREAAFLDPAFATFLKSNTQCFLVSR